MKNSLSFILVVFLILTTHFTAAKDDTFIIAFDDARVNVSASLDKTAAYMAIINYSKSEPITLTQVHSELAGNVRLHHADKPLKAIKSDTTNTNTLTIEARDEEELSAEGYYLLLENLTAPITEGQRIPLLLTFEHGDSFSVDAIAVKVGTHLHGDESEGYSAHNDH